MDEATLQFYRGHAEAYAGREITSRKARLAAFLARHTACRIVPYGDHWRKAIGGEPPVSADGSGETLLLSPARHGTDGFFVAVIKKG